MVFDGALMAYVGMRLLDGGVPYVDVYDMNMPGTYLIHQAWYAVFGMAALPWRLLDLGVALVAGWGVWRLLRPADAPAALLAAVGFVGFHQMHGAYAVGERDFWLATCLVLATVGVLGDDETRRPSAAALVAAGLALGLAVAIKPLAGLFAVGLAGVLLLAGRRRAQGPGALLADQLLLALPAAGLVAAAFGWVVARGGAPGLAILVDELLPVHTRLVLPLGRQLLLLALEPPSWLLPVAVAAPLLVGPGHVARRTALLLGVAYGLVHWFWQGKAWDYHLHPYVAFAWPAAALAWSLPRPTTSRAVLSVTAAVLAGLVLTLQAGWTWVYLKNDHVGLLVRNGDDLAARLRPDDTVQIVGDVGSGLRALVAEGRPMATPFVYDFHFYERADTPEVARWQARFLDDLRAAQPDVIFLSVHSWPSNAWERFEAFPGLTELLEADYALEEETKAWRLYRHQAPATP